MQEKHLYEYAVIRILPRVEREEFLNVGIILFSKKAKYIKANYQLDEQKIRLFNSELDLSLLHSNLKSILKICAGAKDAGKIGNFDIPERFRWLTAVRSTCIQTSRPHSGFSPNLDETFDLLFAELVL